MAEIINPDGSGPIETVAIDQTTPGTTNAVQANAGTNLNTSALALDATLTNGTQRTIVDSGAVTVSAVNLDIRDLAFATDKVDVSGSAVGAVVTGSVTANAGTNLNTSLLALEAGGNLASVKTNTDPLVTAGAGGYVRQDSTATIAKESGGNLASLAAVDFATQTTLALVAAYLLALNTGQQAVADGVVGPLIQGLVEYSTSLQGNATVAPVSLDQQARLRTISASEEAGGFEISDFWDLDDNIWENLNV